MLFGRAALICFCLSAAVCNCFVKNIFRVPLSSRSRALKLMEIDQRSTCGVAPESGRNLDFAKISRRAESFFAEYDADQLESYVPVTLIPKSSFKSFSASIPGDTHQFLKSIGQSMKEFPGTKMVSLPATANLSSVSMLAFYDDTEGNCEPTHTQFDGLWSSLNNQSYFFEGENRTGNPAGSAKKISWKQRCMTVSYSLKSHRQHAFSLFTQHY